MMHYSAVKWVLNSPSCLLLPATWRGEEEVGCEKSGREGVKKRRGIGCAHVTGALGTRHDGLWAPNTTPAALDRRPRAATGGAESHLLPCQAA